ncbi:Cytochrome P450 monooxygenase lepH [Lachnellula suecica]|uniref:Cytochrome P450 monooxygenase lepH n=1 Tax=Lachnellula suecica TaxID=602035 RepID=A0A8T9CCB4_9HELO|nr:Cytochrome P450 monooxygenase lepH [Lachnellula suecica]
MEQIFIYLSLLLLSFIVYFAGFRKLSTTPSTPSNCRDPPELAQYDPVFGFHHFWRSIQLRSQHKTLESLLYWNKLYGRTFKARSLGKLIFYISHPENVKAIFGASWRYWATGRCVAMEPFCSRGFVTTDGDEWRTHRALLAPTLNEANTIHLESLNAAYNRFLADIPDAVEVDLAPIFEELFLDLSLQFLLGKKLSVVRSTESPVNMERFQKAFNASQFWMGLRLAFGGIGRMASVFSKNWKESISTVHSFVDFYVTLSVAELSQKESDIIEGKRPAQQPTESSLVSSLIAQRVPRDGIRSQVIQGMLVTQDTTGIVLSNTIFLLSRAPLIWKRLREEIAALGPFENWTAIDLKRSKLLQNIIQESLRIHPLFATNSRVAVKDTILPTGGGSDGLSPVLIPSGSKVNVCYHTMHHQSSVFGEEVELFNPDRWHTISPSAWEFLPFSHGPRGCAGRYRALTEASYVIARLAVQFERMESRDRRPWTEDLKLVVKNLYGCQAALHAANGAVKEK